MKENDYLANVTQYLDPHLVFPLIEHLQSLQVSTLASFV